MRRLFNWVRYLFTGPDPDPEIQIARDRLDELQTELERIEASR